MDTLLEDQAAGKALAVPADDRLPLGDQPASIAASAQPTVVAQEEDDVIDSAWIAKAKQIIAATAGDPRQQSQQLAALKTEYLQKRYNKSISIAT